MNASAVFWCEAAWLGGDTATTEVLIRSEAGVVVAVQVGVPCPPGATRLAGLTLPGFVNGHSHAFHRALRSRAQVGTGSFWTWRDQMYTVAERLDPDAYYRLARAVYGEMAQAGVTCVGEFHYLHHGPGGARYSDPNAMGAALVAAAADVGVRITLLDTCYLQGGLTAEGQSIPLSPVQLRFSDGTAAEWAARADRLVALAGPGARIGAAVHSVRAVEPAAVELVAEWAAARGAPIHAHVSEQPAENEQCIAAYHLTPAALLEGCGAVGPRFTAVHSTHLSVIDVGLLGAAGSTTCLCPTTERDLADGIGPARALRDAGSRLSLGSDSHAVIDLLEEARAVEMNERLATQVRGRHDARSLLRALTEFGASSLGWHDGGRIAVGAVADLTSIRLDSVRTVGAGPGVALEAAVFAASGADVDTVVVGGRTIVSGGRHCTIDVVAELTAALDSLHGARS